MDAIQKTDSDVVKLKKFFGLREGETLRDFVAECKALTPEDVKELVAAIEATL